MVFILYNFEAIKTSTECDICNTKGDLQYKGTIQILSKVFWIAFHLLQKCYLFTTFPLHLKDYVIWLIRDYGKYINMFCPEPVSAHAVYI